MNNYTHPPPKILYHNGYPATPYACHTFNKKLGQSNLIRRDLVDVAFENGGVYAALMLLRRVVIPRRRIASAVLSQSITGYSNTPSQPVRTRKSLDMPGMLIRATAPLWRCPTRLPLKKLRPSEPRAYNRQDYFCAEMDEQWGYSGKSPAWLFTV